MKDQRNPRVLAIEFDETAYTLVERFLLERFGAGVERARSLRESREMLASGTYDVITLAYILPDGTGLELLQEIASREGHPPVIMVTGQGNEEIASRAVRDGAFGYVLKGDGMEAELADAVRRALERGVLQRAREALEESESFYRSLFDNSDEALFIETLDGVIEDANHVACAMLGYERKDLRGMPASTFIPPNRMDEFEDAQGLLLAGESVEFENARRDGTIIPVEVSAEEVETRRGPRYVVKVRDLTDEKRVQEIVRDKRAFPMQTLDTMPEIFVLVDREGRYLRWNKALNDVTGYSDEEISALSPNDFHPAEEVPRVLAAMRRIFDTGEAQISETRIITSDGRTIPFELSGALVRDENGEPVAIAGLGRDISERRKTEEALHTMVRETNERREEITALLESTRLVLEQEDFDRAARDIFLRCKNLIGAGIGYVALFEERSEELVMVDPESARSDFGGGRNMPVSALHGTRFELDRPFIENSVETSPLFEHIPEGHMSVTNLMLSPLVVGGETVGLMGLANKPGGFDKRDGLMASAFGEIVSIALRNSRNLKRLSESEERFRSVVETANEAIICANSEGDITFWNPGAAATFGYTAEEALGRPLTMIMPERIRRERLRSFIKTASRGDAGAGKTYELVGRRKDGAEFFMELSRSAPWIIGDDVSVTAIIRDVTERKEAEKALERSEAEYRAVVEDQTELIVRYLPGGKPTFVNEAVSRFFGITRDRLLAQDSFEGFLPEEDSAGILQEISTISGERPVVNLEFRMVNAGGETRWMQWRTRGFFDDSGRIVEYQAVGRDVTDRRLADEALRESEQRYRLLFETAPDVIYSVTEEGVFSALNNAFETLSGYSREEWIGRPFTPIVHPDDVPVALRTLEQAMEGQYPEPYELRILRKDGSYVTAEFISAPLMKRDEIAGEFGIARDVTERKAAQRALAESEELYRGLLATSPDPVVVTDLDFNVTMVSDRAVDQQRARGPEDLIGKSALEVLLPEGAARIREEAARILETGASNPTEFSILRRDGTTFLGELTASLLRDPEGNPRAFITTIRDITERKRAERELQALNNELEGYAHAVSHDLKGPLASMGAASATIQSLLKGNADEETLDGVREMSGIIESNVEKSNRLIEDLLDLAEAGQKPLDAGKVDIGEVVRDVLAERRDAIKAKRVKVKVSGDLGRVTASRAHMYQLFSNLIDNAIKHNNARKPVVDIEYMGADETGGHRYAIRDNGPGVPPDESEKIFLPFVSGAGGESGIGLATVMKIVGVYDGTIDVHNDGGARFDFSIRDARA